MPKQVNRYDDYLEHLKKKLEGLKNLVTQTNAAVSPLSTSILPPGPRDTLQKIVQKYYENKIGSYSDQNKEVTIDELLVEMCGLMTNEKEYSPSYAYSGVANLGDDLLTAYFGIQTKQNEIDIVNIFFNAAGISATKKLTFDPAYQLINVVFEGYSTRETKIIGFDFINKEVKARNVTLPESIVCLLVATADGSISEVDLTQRNSIKGHNTISSIKFDVDLAKKISFLIKKDFSRMKSTSLQAKKNDNIPLQYDLILRYKENDKSRELKIEYNKNSSQITS